jgi:multidrug efflux system membrane fusion protein
VKVAVAERRAMPFELAATGMVEPLQTVAVQAQVGGILQRVGFREGDEVKQGQLLFQLDPRPYQAALDQALAALARDRAQATNAAEDEKRYATLVEKEFVTAQQYDQVRTTAAAAQATLAGSQAAVDQARLNLQYSTIRAPISGRTGSLLVREGNLVRANTQQPLVIINRIRPILARFAVPAVNLPLIQAHLGKDIVPEQPVPYDAVKIDYSVDIRLVAQCIDVSPATLQDLNPMLLRLTTPKDQTFELRLPAGTKEAYLAALPHKPPASLLVSLADKTHNAEAILFDYRSLGNDLWGRFNGGADGTRCRTK